MSEQDPQHKPDVEGATYEHGLHVDTSAFTDTGTGAVEPQGPQTFGDPDATNEPTGMVEPVGEQTIVSLEHEDEPTGVAEPTGGEPVHDWPHGAKQVAELEDKQVTTSATKTTTRKKSTRKKQ